MERCIGIDIGGSGVRGAVVQEGRLGSVISHSLVDRSVGRVVDIVAALAEELGSDGTVGVCLPGFIQHGVVRESPNFPAWRDVPMAANLSDALGSPVALMNDANAAALGAWTSRGEKEDLVLLSLGTGVGGGVVIDGRPLLGAGGTGAELGHMYIGGDRRCGCGARGCLETWISTTGLLAAARESGQDAYDGQEIVRRADAGESWAIEVCDCAADALGRGLVTLVNIFNPDTVLLTGGLAGARHRFESRAQAILDAGGIGPSRDRLELIWGPRAEEFSILGVSRNAQRTLP
jgi:glucokinase